jgi:hypothetical protein
LLTSIQRLGDRKWLLTCTYFAGIRLYEWKTSFQGFSSTFIGIQVLSSPWFCYFRFQVLSRISSTCTNPAYCSTQTHYPDSEPTNLCLFLLNAACLAEKKQIPILSSLVWPDRDSNPLHTRLVVSTLTITPQMWS